MPDRGSLPRSGTEPDTAGEPYMRARLSFTLTAAHRFRDEHPFVVAASIVVMAITVGSLLLPRLTFTGDETRYLFASISIWLRGDLQLPQAEWDVWLADLGNRGLSAGHGIHSVFHAALIAPFAGLFQLDGARFAHVLVGLVGAVALVSALRNLALPPRSAVWVIVFCLTIPTIFYLELIFAEIWLFSLFAIGLAVLSRPRLEPTAVIVIFIVLCLLPFIHLRSVGIVIVLGLATAYRVLRERPLRLWQQAVLLAILGVVVFVFAQYQYAVSGSLLGSSRATVRVSWDDLGDRLAVQLFGYRHGLILYNPLALLGLAGLIAGTIRGNAILSIGLLAVVAYLATMMWGTASESHTARFWVAVVPAIVIGAAYWWHHGAPIWKAAATLPLAAITALNAFYVFLRPNDFLTNRFHSATYDTLHHHLNLPLNPSLWAMWDRFTLRNVMVFDDGRALHLPLWCACVLLGLVVLCLGRRALTHMAATVFFAAALAFAAYHSRLSVMEEGVTYTMLSAQPGGGQAVQVEFNDTRRVRGFKIGRISAIPLWGIEDYPRYFTIRAFDADGAGLLEMRVGGRQLNLFRPPISASRLVIHGHGATADSRWPADWLRVF